MKKYNKESIKGHELEAVKQNELAIKYIEKPSIKAIFKSLFH